MPLVWSHLAKRAKRPWWLAPLRFEGKQSHWYVWPGRQWTEIYRRGWHGGFTTLVRVVPTSRVFRGPKSLMEEYVMGFFDKLPGDNNGTLGGALPDDTMFKKDYPAVWQFLTADEYEPGKPRERSSLTLFVEEGSFKFCLSERTKACSCWVTGPTFLDALEALEKRVTSENPEWRSSSKGKKKK